MRLTNLGAALVGVALALGLTACAPATPTTATSGVGAGAPVIGVSLPTEAGDRWKSDGAHLAEVLTGRGYQPDLQFADGTSAGQISQIKDMIKEKVKALVIAPVDGAALASVLKNAADAGITIIAYDRLITGTANVDYYVAFDSDGAGRLQAQYIEDVLNLKNGATGPFNLEVFAGSPDDATAKLRFAGAYDILKGYIDSGVLACPSDTCPASADKWTDVAIAGGDSAKAQAEMAQRLSSSYSGDARVDIVLGSNDSVALGIQQALDGAGYTVGGGYPILTGAGADKANVQAVIDGKQSMTVWEDTRKLGDEVATVLDQVIKGTTVDADGTGTTNNGTKDVPSYLLPPQAVTKATVGMLFDSSVYQRSDFTGLS